MKRLRGYGSEDSQEDCEWKNGFACCDSWSEVSGDELVGGWRREVDMAMIVI